MKINTHMYWIINSRPDQICSSNVLSYDVGLVAVIGLRSNGLFIGNKIRSGIVSSKVELYVLRIHKIGIT